MRELKPLPYGDVNWNEDPCLANIRRRILITSRRNAVIRHITVVFTMALGVGIIKEIAYLVATLCR